MHYFLIACLSLLFSVSSYARETIKIAVSVDNRDAYANQFYERHVLLPLEFLFKRLNARGGNSPLFEVVRVNDVCLMKYNASTIRRYISEGVDVVLGQACSNNTKDIISNLNKNFLDKDIFFFNVESVDTEINKNKYPYFFHINYNINDNITKSIDFIVKRNIKRVGLVHDKDVFLDNQKLLEALNGQSIDPYFVDRINNEDGAKSYAEIIDNIKKYKPELLFFMGNTSEIVELLKLIKENKLNVKILSLKGGVNGSLTHFFDDDLLSNVYFNFMFFESKPNELIKDFFAYIQKNYPELEDYFLEYTFMDRLGNQKKNKIAYFDFYDAYVFKSFLFVEILQRIIQQTNSDKNTDWATNYHNQGLKTFITSFDKLVFDEYGKINNHTRIGQWKEGKLVVVD